MSNFNSCPFPHGAGCPYQTEGGCNDRNRFPHGHLFVGEIENGKRYPYGVYSKDESDERYAVKSVESYVAQLAEDVSTKAEESECVAIRARLDALENNPISIKNFEAEPNVCEMGSSVDIVLTWELNKAPTSQDINGYAVTGESKTYTGVSNDTVYTLTVSDGTTSESKTATVSFYNQIYYGAASNLETVAELDHFLSNSPDTTISVNAGTGQYIVFALPLRLGEVALYVNGFEGGFEEAVILTITNASGYQEMYRVYRSTNANLGQTTVEVKGV